MTDPSQSRTSATLLGRVQASTDDHEAWQEFVRRYQPKIQAWCLRWNLQLVDAEEVAQAVLTKMVAKLKHFQYDPSKSFRAWLKTVTHNAWRDFASSHKPGQRGSGDPEVQQLLDNQAAPHSLEQHLHEEFQREILEEAMSRVQARVEPHTWQAFHLRTFGGQSGQQVAETLGLAVPAVFMAKNRILKMLREEIRRLEQ